MYCCHTFESGRVADSCCAWPREGGSIHIPNLGPGVALVVDDEPSTGRRLKRWLGRAGVDTLTVASAAGCLQALEQVLPDLVFIDERLPESLGVELLHGIRQRHPLLPLILIVTKATTATAVTLVEQGGFDYLLKPLEEPKVYTAVRNALNYQRLSTRVVSLEREVKGQGYSQIVGQSESMKVLYRRLDRVAASDITVLIHGESGTGKELVARAIHEHGGRRKGPFVAINCAAIPEALQESEIFGHEKGSFTGATARRIGRFEQADGGTLFFDEIGELSLAFQAKLLRVLQERSFQRVGGSKDISTDVRIVAATNRNLADWVKARNFREDLYYRLAVMELDLPPLHERDGDVPLLAQMFLEEFDAASGQESDRSIAFDAMEALIDYRWPGNVRELQNVVHRAAVLTDAREIALHDFPDRISDLTVHKILPDRPPLQGTASDGVSTPTPEERVSIPPGTTLAELERAAVVQAYQRADGNVARTARELGIGRAALYRKLKRCGLREA